MIANSVASVFLRWRPLVARRNRVVGSGTTTNGPRILTVGMVCACVLCLPGCSAAVAPDSTASRPTLSVAEACASLEGALERADLRWPVANQPITAKSSESLVKGFEEVAVGTTGDLRITLDAWIDGFRFVSPYIVANDPEGAAKAANDVQKESILLASTNLATFCQW